MNFAFSDISWSLVVLGVAAGLLSSMLGIGSGIVLVPALVLIFGFGQKSAQGTALAAMVPMALVGAVRYYHSPDIGIDLWKVVLIAVGAVVGAYVGSSIALRLPALTLRRIFACFMMLVAVKMMVATFGKQRSQQRQGVQEVRD